MKFQQMITREEFKEHMSLLRKILPDEHGVTLEEGVLPSIAEYTHEDPNRLWVCFDKLGDGYEELKGIAVDGKLGVFAPYDLLCYAVKHELRHCLDYRKHNVWRMRPSKRWWVLLEGMAECELYEEYFRNGSSGLNIIKARILQMKNRFGVKDIYDYDVSLLKESEWPYRDFGYICGWQLGYDRCKDSGNDDLERFNKREKDTLLTQYVRMYYSILSEISQDSKTLADMFLVQVDMWDFKFREDRNLVKS